MSISLRWIARTQFGVDLRTFLSAIAALPRYVRDLYCFRKAYKGPIELMPCLHDQNADAGNIADEYFWQDLYVARLIHAAGPDRHVDVGSRIDGFVAHVAAFREIEVFDLRPVTQEIPGVIFRQTDITAETSRFDQYCSSLSCLHALEHFGLGRYGDRIDPRGDEKGLAALAAMLRSGGVLYLSVPVGRERVLFNANRVLDPRKVVSVCASNGLHLRSLAVVKPDGDVVELGAAAGQTETLAVADYTLAIFTFEKERTE